MDGTGSEGSSVKIISLRAENVKRLKAVEITPDGNTVVIAGRNAQGKSSVLDAIWMALAGASGAKETSRPIRDGETKASVQLDLGELVVTRTWTDAGTTLHVESNDGARYPTPQTILDGLIGKLSFDPLAFAEEAPKRQLEMLLEVVQLPFEPAELDARRRGVFEQRTDVNREVKRLEAQLSGLPPVRDDTPNDEVSAAAIAAELREAERIERDRVNAHDEAEAAKNNVGRLQRELQEAEQHLKAALAHVAGLPAAPDTSEIRARLEAADHVNAAVRVKKQGAQLAAELTAARASSSKLSERLEEIDRTKAEAIEQAQMPLEGLSFDEEGVLYQGVPFSQASSAERLRVGIAMAMALNPKIRVIRITDGSLLDSENLELIERMAGEHDFQIWIERVDETGQVGVTIEDGQVVHVEEVAAA